MKIDVERVEIRFGAVVAVAGPDLRVPSGQRHGLIGPNGAGKSSLFNAIAGEIRPVRGAVRLDGIDVTHRPAWFRARTGLARTFQRSTLFHRLTVAENLAVSERLRSGGAWRPWPGRLEPEVRRRVHQRLEAIGFGEVAGREVGTLSHGEQRLLEVELALAQEPRALLLDEPLAGLGPGEREAMVARLRSLPAAITVLIVEHDLEAVFSLAEVITVLDRGMVIASGSPAAIQCDPRVREVYLGSA